MFDALQITAIQSSSLLAAELGLAIVVLTALAMFVLTGRWLVLRIRHGHQLARGVNEMAALRSRTGVEAPRGSTEVWTLDQKTQAVSLRPLDLTATR